MSTTTASLTKKDLVADHPSWCPGCGDFAVLAAFYKFLEKRQLPHQDIVVIAGIGCSSRFPYFMNTHGVHFIHGRALPLATGVSLSRPNLHVFTFGGDGDNFSIGGNHIDHAARKNIKMTSVIMDNSVYGLTKKQTSPTSQIGYKTKTDPAGAIDQPVNPIKKMIASGASMICRTHASYPNHMIEMFDKAFDHEGFSVIEVLSECVEFNPGAYDAAIKRKGGEFRQIEEKKNDGSPEDAERHDSSNATSAFELADQPFPGAFGVFYRNQRPTKNLLEQNWINQVQPKYQGKSSAEILQQTFNRMK